MGYDNYNGIPDKILLPDGSIVSFISATEVAPPDSERSRIYDTLSLIPAKFLMPDGSIVAGLPLTFAITGTDIEGSLIVSDGAGGLAYSVELINRVTTLEDTYVRSLWFEQINSGTTGTVTVPTGGTIVLDQWAAGIDAVTSTITAGAHPDFISATTAAGEIITATMDSLGNWTISGSPSAYPISIIYAYEVKLVNFNRTYSLVEEEVTQSTGPLSTPTFANLYDTGLTASKSVFTDISKKLVSGTNTDAEVSSAVSLKHTQGTDQGLDTGGSNAVTAADLKTLKDTTVPGKEEVANKSTSVTTDATSDVKYPSVKAVKDYADGLVVGLLDDRGSYDASGNVFPSTGGSGAAGAILKGDLWYISVQGTLGGVVTAVGSSIRALTDAPGQTAGNWDILNVGLGYTPENSANKRTSFQVTPDDTHYPSEKLTKDSLDAKVSHSLATAVNDFLVASGVGVFVKKTLAEVKIILGLGSAAYTDTTAYDAAGAAASAANTVQGNLNTHTGLTGTNVHGLGSASTHADTEYVKHSLATALSDMIFASGAGAFIKKTLAEGRTLLGLDGATTKIAVGGGDNQAIVWTEATGTGAPVRAGSPTLTGTPLAPTAADNTATTQISTTAFVQNALTQRLPLFYGVTWNESTDAYTRTGSIAGQAVGVTLADAFLPIQRRMRGCLLSDAGAVNYYLSATDWTKKEDGATASVLTGADGQVMIEIPKFWYRYGYAGTTHTYDVSPVPLAGFTVHPAFLSGATELSFAYVGAYEGVLYDTSGAKYENNFNPVASHSATFDVDNGAGKGTITAGAGTPYTLLLAGYTIVITGTVDNNGTYVIDSVAGGNVITCTTVIAGADGVEATTVISAITADFTATTGDVLSSVSGKLPWTLGTRANFRAIAANRGTGWSQWFRDVEGAIQLLFLTEYASFYSQSVIGAGISNVTDWAAYNNYYPIAPTGNSNAIGNATGNTAGSTACATEASKYMSYRGIENWYGHIWKFTDGFNVNNNIPYLCNVIANFADDTASNYTNPTDVNGVAVTMNNAGGWQSTLAKIGRGFMPVSVGANGSTKITDYYWQAAGWRVSRSGGDANNGAVDGGLCLNVDIAAANASSNIGSRLCYRK